VSNQQQLRGLYAITDRSLAAEQGVVHQVEQALAGGARLVQYRDKSNHQARRLAEATALLARCRAARVPLLINDDIELTRQIGADGVHLGQHDASLQQARQRLGAQALIGVSCYNRFELAQQAAAAGADYVAFGRFFSSVSKPQAVQATPRLLHRARRELALPTVAIGGITPENGGALIDAGADMLAVIHGLFGQLDIRAACQQFLPLCDHTEESPT